MPPLHPSTAEWDSPPAVSRPPHPLPILLLPAKFVIGFFYTSFLLACLVLITPFLLLFRFLKYVHDKLFLPRSCDILWPRPPFNRSFLWLSQTVSLDSIKAILNGQPSPANKCCFVPTPEPEVEVEPWDHEKAPLHTNDDFITYVKGKLTRPSYVAQVRVVRGFENNAHGRSLLVIKTHPDTFQLCMARIVTALSQGNIAIEVEPRVFYECALDHDASCQKIRRGADAILKAIESFCVGPFNLSLLIRSKPEKVWRALVAEPDQVTAYRRRPSLLNGGGIAEESSRLTIANEAQLKEETTASFSIIEICDVDGLQKAERLLRATMAELLTSFLAGALRKYFRESDPCVKHPPDCTAAFAVCNHKTSQCDTGHSCDHLLLPIELPIGVEGMIPRLWSLQQQFAEHGKRCIPQALKVFNSIVRFILPREAANRVANVFFNHSIINISFLRIHGDVMLDNSLLTRFIPVPPLFLPSRASFVFVQHRDKIHLVSSIDRGLFDRHTNIFKYMKEEQAGLQEHLAFRLRSLTQTCVLPARLPSEDAAPPPPEAPTNSPTAERDELLPCPSHSRPRRQSMADLSELLKEVQDELDEMRRNPNVNDRDGTILRLHALEEKIQTFHNGMKSELWGNTVWVRQEKDEAMQSVKELLAPYRRRVSVTGRKTSLRASSEHDKIRRSSVAVVSSASGEEVERMRVKEERRNSEERRRRNGEEGVEMVEMVNEERREGGSNEVKVEVHVEETEEKKEEDKKEEEMKEEKKEEEK